jgi:hypothetical protein
MAANIGGGRALQVCDLCGGVDDHPRHSFAGFLADAFPAPDPAIVAKVAKAAPAADQERLVAEVLDTGTTSRHKDCCRQAGCPTGECDTQLDGWDGAVGKGLLTHILKEG